MGHQLYGLQRPEYIVYGHPAEDGKFPVDPANELIEMNISIARPAGEVYDFEGLKLQLRSTCESGPGFSGDIAFTESDILELDAQIAGVMESGLSEDDLAFNFLMTYEGI